MSDKDLVEKFEIGAELSALVAQGKITPAIAEKIKEKVKEKNLTLTKDQLYKLVEKINSYLRKESSGTPSPPSQPSVSPMPALPQSKEMEKFLQTLENLHKRVEKLEKMQNEWMKSIDVKVKESKPEDIKVPGEEKIEYRASTLDSLPTDPEGVVIVMKWLQYLVDRVGKENISKVLDYYVDIGWITDDVKIKLLEYCEGITEETKERRNLVAKDHIQSFLYIQKLKGKDIDEHFLGKIERDLNKLNKNLESLSFQ